MPAVKGTENNFLIKVYLVGPLQGSKGSKLMFAEAGFLKQRKLNVICVTI